MKTLKFWAAIFPSKFTRKTKNAEHARRREYAIYLGHDRLSEGSNAHALQYPEQRQNHRRRYEIYKNDKLCITVPFFHCFGLVLAMMACITHGTTMVPVERYSPVPVMNAISVEKCTAVHGVPTMFIAMLEHAQFNNFDFSSLRTGIMAGSPCPIEVMKKSSTK